MLGLCVRGLLHTFCGVGKPGGQHRRPHRGTVCAEPTMPTMPQKETRIVGGKCSNAVCLFEVGGAMEQTRCHHDQTIPPSTNHRSSIHHRAVDATPTTVWITVLRICGSVCVNLVGSYICTCITTAAARDPSPLSF